MLQVTREHWFFRDGKPTGFCRTCRAAAKTKHNGPYGWVPVDKVRSLMVEIVDRAGSVDAASEMSGVSSTAIRNIISGGTRRVQKKTVRLLVLSLHERRKFDRLNGSSARYVEARKKQAEIEERIGRLVGY